MKIKKILSLFSIVPLLASCGRMHWRIYFKDKYWTFWESIDSAAKLVVTKDGGSGFLYLKNGDSFNRFFCHFMVDSNPYWWITFDSEDNKMFICDAQDLDDHRIELKNFIIENYSGNIETSYVLYSRKIQLNEINILDIICNLSSVEIADFNLSDRQYGFPQSNLFVGYYKKLEVELKLFLNHSFTLNYDEKEYLGRYSINFSTLHLIFDEGYSFENYQALTFDIK